MSFTLLVRGSTRLLQLRPRHRWSPAAYGLSTRETASPPTLHQDPNVDLPTTLIKPDGPSEPRLTLVIREGAPTPAPALVLLSSTLAPGSTNELRSSRREIERRLPPSILVLGLCLASPPPNRKLCLPSPDLRAMVRRPMGTPNPLRLHPSRRPRRDLGRRNRFQPFLLSNRGIPTVSCLSTFILISVLTLPSRFPA